MNNMFSIKFLAFFQKYSTKRTTCTKPLKNLYTTLSEKNIDIDLKAEIKNKILFNTILYRNKLVYEWNLSEYDKKLIKRKEWKLIQNRKDTSETLSTAFKYLSHEEMKFLSAKAGINTANFVAAQNDDKNDEINIKYEDTRKNETKLTENLPEFLDLVQHIDFTEKTDALDFMEFSGEDPNMAPSKVSCSGCGAFLQCRNKNEPGFIGKELFQGVPDKHLRALICQRCHYLKYYSTSLNVNVSPDEYPKIISQIKDRKALILLVVDLFDFPCSVWPDITKFVGAKRPFFIVGNKVDLLPCDDRKFLNRIENLLKSEVQKFTNISSTYLKHLVLVSARTGYGIEKLISLIFDTWQHKGDIYLIGCTNVGKSSLFNVLLNSDLCKIKAVNLVPSATISNWPGTTLNLLKFPLLNPNPSRLATRNKRLIMESKDVIAEEKLRKEEYFRYRDIELTTLTGHVGRTFRIDKEEVKDSFSMPVKAVGDFDPGTGLNERDPEFIDSKWFYDTPGTFHPDQILSLLTEEELKLVIPQVIISPRTYKINPGQTIFIGGISRLDYVNGQLPVLLTVFTSKKLPITICDTIYSEQIYSELIGTNLFAVPIGDKQRLKLWPGVDYGDEIILKGQGWKMSCADIILSSSGWISVTTNEENECTFKPYTPNKRGIHLRQPSLLPFAVSRRGKKVRNSPAYSKFIPFVLKKN